MAEFRTLRELHLAMSERYADRELYTDEKLKLIIDKLEHTNDAFIRMVYFDRLQALKIEYLRRQVNEARRAASIGAQPALKTGAVVAETTQVRSLCSPPNL